MMKEKESSGGGGKETCGGEDIGAEEIGENVAEKGLQIVVVLLVGRPCNALSKFV